MAGKRKKEGVYSIQELAPEVRKKVLEKWRYEIWSDYDSDQLSDDFKEMLSQRGFSNPEVCWSLSSCQGDGVAFWGHLDLPDLFKWIFSGEKLAKPFVKLFKPFVKLQDHVGVRVTHHGNYCHWNSMSLEVEFTGREEDFIPEEMRRSIRLWQDRRGQLPKGPKEWRPGTGIPRNIQDVIDQAAKDYQEAEKLIGDFEKELDEFVKTVSRELEKIGYAEMDYRQSDEYIIEFLEGNEYEFDEEGDEL